MDFKKTNAEPSTVTRDIRKFDGPTGNIYEAVAIISKRANQISSEMKEELQGKLQEFASHSDNLEEIFENLPDLSIDYGLLEKTDNVSVLSVDIGWTDL